MRRALGALRRGVIPVPEKNKSHLHHHPGPRSGRASIAQARSSVLPTADLPVGSGKVATSSASGLWAFAGPGLHSAPNKCIKLARTKLYGTLRSVSARSLCTWRSADLEVNDA